MLLHQYMMFFVQHSVDFQKVVYILKKIFFPKKILVFYALESKFNLVSSIVAIL